MRTGRGVRWVLGAAGVLGTLAAPGRGAAQPVRDPDVRRAALPFPAVARAVRATGAVPVLDGRMDEAVWQDAPVITDFTQVVPVDGGEPSERTEVHVTYDADALYILARMFDDDPAAIVRRLGRRDSETSSDFLQVSIDSYHDHRTAFEFSVNAAGVRRDARAADDGSSLDTSWDPVWEAAVSVDSLGWVAEMKIPFSQLRFSRDAEQTWGINFTRVIFRKHETVRWAWTRNTEGGYVSLFGHLEGLRNIPQPKRLEALPYTVASADFDQSADRANPFNDGSVAGRGVGLDLKYGVTSDLTLDATVNPDFGQVEVDPAVVNLTAFETYYQEQRPFFLESANLFQLGRGGAPSPTLFYSRRIGRPPARPASEPGGYVDNPSATSILGAGKLSGKVGSWSLGFIDAVTSRERARVQAADGTRATRPVEPLANYGVASLRRDFRNGNTGIGFLATSVNRHLDDPVFDGLRREAYTGGVNFFHRWGTQRWTVSGNFAGSWVAGDTEAMTEAQRSSARYYQRPDQDYKLLDPTATSLSGSMTSLRLAKDAGSLTAGTSFYATSPGFEVNDAGFRSTSDMVFHEVWARRRWLDPGRVFRRFGVVADWYQTWNFGGTNTYRAAEVDIDGQLLNYWSFQLWTNQSLRTLSDNSTRGGPLIVRPHTSLVGWLLSSDTREKFSGAINGVASATEDGNRSVRASPSLTFRPSGALSLNVGLAYAKSWGTDGTAYVTQLVDPAATATYGGRYLFGNLRQRTLDATVRADMALSPSLSIQWYAQPYVTTGDYEDFKELARPRSFDFLHYGTDGASTLAYDAGANSYTADPDGDGPAPAFAFANPDFSFRSLKSNLVVRWEYRPGSTLFLVWNHGRSVSATDPTVGILDETGRLFGDAMRNTFMLKVNYWLSR